MEPQDRAITVLEARERVRNDPKRYKAGVIEGQPPLRDRDANSVVLFRLIKTADEYLRSRDTELRAQGWVRAFGSLGGRVLRYARGDETRAVGIDKR